MVGGVHRLQRWNEFTNHWMVHIVLGHIVLAIALILILLRHRL
jgi:hypothetical protein